VELLSFTAKAIDNTYVQLDWATVTEIENEGFEVERSTDGINFEMIGWVEGNGNSTAWHNYQFIDTEPYEEVNYYRLKQIDYDDDFEYSKIVSARITSEQSEVLSNVTLMPNPANDRFSIVFSSIVDAEAQIKVSNSLGQKIEDLNVNLKKGSNTITMDSSPWANGVYLIQLQTGIHKKILRLVVSH
jgi:hypothetical protein